jgi:asparagine synthase (glutamine-hydrolysing)
LRRALADLLPAKVLYRGGKWGPSLYFAPRLLQLDRDRLREALTAYLPSAEAYLDSARVWKIFERPASQGTVEDAFCLWNAINLGAWLQISHVSI